MAKVKQLTPKQEAFVVAYIETGNAVEAYKASYDAEDMTYASIDKEARRLLEHPRIAPRIQRLGRHVEAKALLSLEEHMDELRSLRDMAKQKDQLSAAIKAEELRGKLRRFYVDQIENGKPGDFDDMTTEELDEFLHAEAQELLAERKSAKGKGATRH